MIYLQQRVKPSYKEDPFAIFLPNYFVLFLPLHCLFLEFRKKPLHDTQLPIIQVPNKMKVPISSFQTSHLI